MTNGSPSRPHGNGGRDADGQPAPAGKAKEWNDRFWCEERVRRAKQDIAGSWIDKANGRHSKRDRRHDWNVDARTWALREGVALAEEVMSSPGDWAFKRRNIVACFEYASRLREFGQY